MAIQEILRVVAPLIKSAPSILPILGLADPRIAALLKGRDLANLKEVVDAVVELVTAISDGQLSTEEMRTLIKELGEIKQVQEFVEDNREEVLSFLDQTEEVINTL